MMPDTPRGGAGCEEGHSEATPEHQPKQQQGHRVQGEKGRESWAADCSPLSPTPKPGARHTVDSPEKSRLAGLGSNPRPSP